MARSIFLTALLASAILAYVQSNPVPDNSSKTLIISADLPEPVKPEVQNNLKEQWIDVSDMMYKKYKELDQDPTISKNFLNTLNTAIDVLKLSIDENIDGSDKLNDPELDKNEQLDSWEKFQKEMTEKYEEMNNEKVKETVEKIANAKRETKKFIQHVVCTLHRQMENLEKAKDEEIVIRYCDDVPTSNDKAEQDWKKFKKQLEDKYPEIWKKPQVKKIFENIKDIIKNIIESIRKEAIEYHRTKNSENKQDDSSHLGLLEKVKNGFDDIKNQVGNTLKEVVEKKSKIIDGAKDSIKKMVESFKNHTSNGSKPLNSEEEEENSTSLDSKDEEKETLNELKKKFDETLKEFKEKWSKHSETLNSEEEEENPTTPDLKDEAMKKLNELMKRSEETLKKFEEQLKKWFDKSKAKEIIDNIKKLKSSTPKTLNSEEEEENPTTPDLKDEAMKKLNELMKRSEETLKKFEEQLKKWFDKSKAKEIIDNIKKLKSSTPKPLNSEEEEENSTTLDSKDGTKKMLDELKKRSEETLKKFEKQLKKWFDKSKTKEIIDNIKKLKSSTPKPLNSEEEEENPTTPDLKDKAMKKLNELKKRSEETLKKFEEQLKKWFDKSKAKEIIDNIKKLKSSTPKPLNSEEEEENPTTPDLKDEAMKKLNELKKKSEETLKKFEKQLKKWFDKSKTKEIIDNIKKLKSSTPKPLNSEEEEENPTTPDWKDEVMKKLNELKNTCKEKLKELLNDPKWKENIDAIKKEICKPPKQPGNPENEEELKDGEKKDSESGVMEKSGKEAWDNLKKKVEELLKNILSPSKVKEVIEGIKNATCSTPKPLNSEEEEENSTTLDSKDGTKKMLDELKKRSEETLKKFEEQLNKWFDKSKAKEIIDNIKKLKSSNPEPENSEMGEENSGVLGLQKKAQEAWNDFKKNNPKVNEVIEEWKKVVKQGKDIAEEIIKSVTNKNNKQQELS